MTRKISTIPTGLLLTGAVWPAISMPKRCDEIALSDADSDSIRPEEDTLWGEAGSDDNAIDQNPIDSAHWLDESWPTGTDSPMESGAEVTGGDTTDKIHKNRDVT